jgi:hypothetical protein
LTFQKGGKPSWNVRSSRSAIARTALSGTPCVFLAAATAGSQPTRTISTAYPYAAASATYGAISMTVVLVLSTTTVPMPFIRDETNPRRQSPCAVPSFVGSKR